MVVAVAEEEEEEDDFEVEVPQVSADDFIDDYMAPRPFGVQKDKGLCGSFWWEMNQFV